MLENVSQTKIKKEKYEEQLSAMQEKLIDLANAVKAAKIPVIVTIDGWAAAGKGVQISKLIKYMDPRFYNVEPIRKPNEAEIRKPWLHRFWMRLPKQGDFLILDGSWFSDTVKPFMNGDIDDYEYDGRRKDINVFERQLHDDGYVIIKYFLHITCGEQKKRLTRLKEDEFTRWRVDDRDFTNNKHYDKIAKRFDRTLVNTNTAAAPWHIIPANDKFTAQYEMMRIFTETLEGAVEARKNGTLYTIPPEFPVKVTEPEQFALEPVKKLSQINMNKSLTDEEYRRKLKKYQDRLFELQNLCYQHRIPVIIAYEGWDAGGKGGNIKRVVSSLDPRGYEVKPISAPEPSELARHYLWRFWTRLP
ncbi:MAG: phosphate--AMP phosphotransferase, partial [Ruminiclostridium sp.]|nr:phosphate--AMP phosphotransferase [Ruminiclostridium sp.]